MHPEVAYTHVAFQFTQLLDRGAYEDMEATRQVAVSGDCLTWIKQRYPGEVDFAALDITNWNEVESQEVV